MADVVDVDGLEQYLHHKPDGWYYEDETNCDDNGPFPTKEEAMAQLKSYIRWLDRQETGRC